MFNLIKKNISVYLSKKDFLKLSKIIVILALPVIIENILQTLLGTIDTFFASKINPNAIAAISVVNLLMNIFVAFFTAISTGSCAIISRYIGLKDYEKATSSSKVSIILSLILGLSLGLFSFLFSDLLLSLIGISDDVLIFAIPYFSAVAIPCVFLSLMIALSCILRSSGDTKTPMIASAIANILNIVFNYIFIFGIFSFDGLGILGAGIATTLSRIIAVLFLFYKLYFGSYLINLKGKWNINNSIMKSILSIGIPSGLEKLIMRSGQMVYGSLIISLGTTSYIAHNIAGTIESYSYLPAMGFGVAAATLVGQSLGSNDVILAKKYGFISNVFSTIIMVFIGIIFFIFAPSLAKIFTNDTEVITLTIIVLRIIAIFQPFLSASNIFSSALQGAGDTKFPMYSTLIGIWGCRIIFGFIFSTTLQLGLVGIWLAYALDIIIRAILLVIRFYKSNLNTIKI